MKKLKFLGVFVILFLIGALKVNASINLEAIAEELAPGGTFEINTIAPKNGIEFDFYTYMDYKINYENNLPQDVGFAFYNCNQNYTTCDLRISVQGTEDPVPVDTHTVQVTMGWQPINTKAKEKIDGYVNKLNEIRGMTDDQYNNYYFHLIDLNLVSYYLNTITGEEIEPLNVAFTYSEDFRKMFDNSNLTYLIDFRAGDGTPFNTYAFGGLLLYYNNIAYGLTEDVGVKNVQVLYVPTNTQLTDNALIAAAQARLDKYFPGTNITVKVGLPFDQYDDGAYENPQPIDFSEFTDLSKTTDHTYILDFGELEVPFVIVADSTKMIDLEYNTRDLGSDISIGTDVTTIPLDTIINVNELSEDDEDYQKLLEVIGADKMKSYDLALFSQTKKDNITKLDNGKFLVSIPIPEEFEGKKLVVYYVNEKNEKTAYDVTVKDGFATFETDHFSIYNLTLSNEIDNPKTLDNISSYIALGSLSLIGLAATATYIYKKRYN